MAKKSDEKMFLGSGMIDVTQKIRDTHHLAIQLAEDANILANRLLFATNANRSKKQQVLIALLLPRLLTAFQGCVLVGERGLFAEAELLARKVVEVTFLVVAISKSESAADAYMQNHHVTRKNLLGKLKRSGSMASVPEEFQKLEQQFDQVAAQVRSELIKPKDLKWFANEAGMSSSYDIIYAALSQSAHVNVGDLQKLMELDEGGDIVALRYGPESERLSHLFCAATEYLLISLDAAFTVLPNGNSKELDRLWKEMSVLSDELELQQASIAKTTPVDSNQ